MEEKTDMTPQKPSSAVSKVDYEFIPCNLTVELGD